MPTPLPNLRPVSAPQRRVRRPAVGSWLLCIPLLAVALIGNPTSRAAGPNSVVIVTDGATPAGLAKAYRSEVEQLLSSAKTKVTLTVVDASAAAGLNTVAAMTGAAAPKLIVTLGTTASMRLAALIGEKSSSPRVIAVGWTSIGPPSNLPKGWTVGWTHDLSRAQSYLIGLIGAKSDANVPIIADIAALPGIPGVVAPPAASNGAALAPFAKRMVILGPISGQTPAKRQALALALTRIGAIIYDAQAPETAEVGAALAAISVPQDIARMTRWAALKTLQAVEGKSPSSPVEDLRGDARSALNLQVATQLGIDVSWKELGQSRVVTQGTSSGGLTLTQAVTLGLKTSLQLKSSQLAVGSADADVQAAMGRLLPQLSASLGGTLIEPDSARFAGGANPQFKLDFDLSLSQLLYSEQAWTGYDVSKLARKAAKQDQASTLLDVVEAVAGAWIQAQRAAAVVTIQRELLEASRANLGLAEGRIRAGKSTSSERLRWESQIASDTAGVMDAVLNANLARLSLARAMGLPPTSPPTLATVSLSALAAENGSNLLAKAGDSNTAVRALERRLLKQALATDPEIGRLATLRRAQKLQAVGATREMFIPTISLQAGLSARVAEAGAGVPTVTVPGAPVDPALFLGFKVSLPLFDGTTRYATLTKTRSETRRLDVAIAARKQGVSGDLITAFRQTTIAFAKVRIQTQAAETARQSAALTAGAYKRGSTGISPVLDAQAQVNRAALALIDAQYGAEAALIGLYRQVGAFYFLLTADEKTRWQSTLNATAAAAKGAATPRFPSGSQP